MTTRKALLASAALAAFSAHSVQSQEAFDLGTLVLRDKGTAWTLETTHGSVAIQAHHQVVAQGFCLLQRTHVPHVQQVEAPISKDNGLLALSQYLANFNQLLARKYPGFSVHHRPFDKHGEPVHQRWLVRAAGP